MFMDLFITKSTFDKSKMSHVFLENYCSKGIRYNGTYKDSAKMLQDILSTRQTFVVSEALTYEVGLELLMLFLTPPLTKPVLGGIF